MKAYKVVRRDVLGNFLSAVARNELTILYRISHESVPDVGGEFLY